MTLTELLIVLAVITVLAALVMPAFTSARIYAQRAVCISNLHQATLAITMYAEDYDGVYPSFLADRYSAVRPLDLVYWHDHFCQGTELMPNQITWVSLAGPYAGRGSGSGKSDKAFLFHCPADGDQETRPVTSYEFKMWLAENRTEPEVAYPAGVALLWEQWAYHTGGTESEHDRRAAMNIGFVDGHAGWVRLSQTTTAIYGEGPDLHWSFQGGGGGAALTGLDVVAQ